jgi:hypothetical protein
MPELGYEIVCGSGIPDLSIAQGNGVQRELMKHVFDD